MTVQEYAESHGVTPRTVYRWIEEGQIKAKKVGNMWQVISQEMDSTCQLEKTIERQENEIEYLRNELSQANQTISEMQQRHDMIVMSFTKQLEQQTLMLEDLRHRSLWFRVKTVFGFATS